MKRSGFLKRTPFSDRALPVSGKPRTRTPLNPQSKKRIKDGAARKKALAVLRAQSVEMFGSVCCWMCGRTREVHGHELRGMAQGGDYTKPDALLCNPCNGWCEEFPFIAAWGGWKITGKSLPVLPCITDGSCRPWMHTCGATNGPFFGGTGRSVPFTGGQQ